MFKTCRRMAPLTGVKILDLSRLLPGPYATQLLVDLGAQVTKMLVFVHEIICKISIAEFIIL
jgi:crotonobetainyl-CoA:carnitine CoA-transferase CaiB-like acyl-CoA transferase